MANEENTLKTDSFSVQVLKLLPTSIKLKGVGLIRQMSVDGKTMNLMEAQAVSKIAHGFNWGYVGQEPKQLAIAILLEYLPPVGAVQVANNLVHGLLSKIKLNNFEGDVKLREIMKVMFEKGELDEARVKDNYYFFFKEIPPAEGEV